MFEEDGYLEEHQMVGNGLGDNDDVKTTYSQRITHWCAFMISSLITLGATLEAVDHSLSGGDERVASHHNLPIACAAITFALSTMMVGAHLSSSTTFVGTKIEGSIIFVLVLFWGANSVVISNSQNGIAVDNTGAIRHANLYYFCWASFLCTMILFVSFLQTEHNMDLAASIARRSARMTHWFSFIVFALIMFGASANIFDEFCTGQVQVSAYCRYTEFSIFLAVGAVIISSFLLALKIMGMPCPFSYESSGGIFLFILFFFGVVFITNEDGPGAVVGNLYYSTWGSFICSFMICSSLFQECHAPEFGTSPPSKIGDGNLVHPHYTPDQFDTESLVLTPEE